MKFSFALAYFFFATLVFSNNSTSTPNTILAIINDSIITSEDLENFKHTTRKDNEKTLEDLILRVIINQKIVQYKIKPSEELIMNALLQIATNNNIPISQLQKAQNYNEIVKEVLYTISYDILLEKIANEEKFIQNNKNKSLDSWLRNQYENSYIVILNK